MEEISSRLAGLDRLWAETRGDSRVCIAVLDGPVDRAHPCFAGADLIPVETLVPGEVDEGPASCHGTHVASIIFGRHGSAIQGIAPGCRGLILPVFQSGKEGSLAPCSQIDLARAITTAVEHGAHVINISGGELEPSGQGHQILANAVRLCSEAGVLIVAAAGNDGCRCLHIPAALPSVLAVGAMSAEGTPLEFSNWGEAYRRQGILAPGERITGALPGGGVTSRSGTSYATPIVSGIAALLLSLELARGRRLDVRAVLEALLGSAVGCDTQPVPDCRRLLGGRLNIPAAISRLEKGAAMEISESRNDVSLQQVQRQGAACPTCDMPAVIETTSVRAAALTPSTAAAQPAEDARGVTASGCGCGGSQPPARAYALGQIGFDFGTEARRDSFIQAGVANPDDPRQLLDHLADHPSHATAMTWTLIQETTPIYAIQPGGAFAAETYDTLRKLLEAQLTEGVERVSIPGLVGSKTQLASGQTLPILWPELRGIYSWSTPALVAAVLGRSPSTEDSAEDDEEKRLEIENFLDRIYYEIRNLGLSSQERAINFAATNAFQVERVFESAIKKDLKLSGLAVERSPVCRPESDCWDVKLTFFNPLRRLEQAQEVYRFTIDVSDIVPVTVGRVRHWQVY